MLCPNRECNGTPEVTRHGKLRPILNKELSVVADPLYAFTHAQLYPYSYLRNTVVPLSTSLNSKSIGKTPTK